MIKDAERVTGPVWAADDDRRITRVGRMLRKSRLDELPQVINVWKGDMSLVGPRPERPELVKKFVQEIPQFNTRLLVRPGIAGLAQVRGEYSTPPRNKLRYDELYIRNMNPILDIKLLVQSVLVAIGLRKPRRRRKANGRNGDCKGLGV